MFSGLCRKSFIEEFLRLTDFTSSNLLGNIFFKPHSAGQPLLLLSSTRRELCNAGICPWLRSVATEVSGLGESPPCRITEQQTVCTSQCHSSSDPKLCRDGHFFCLSLVFRQVHRVSAAVKTELSFFIYFKQEDQFYFIKHH